MSTFENFENKIYRNHLFKTLEYFNMISLDRNVIKRLI